MTQKLYPYLIKDSGVTINIRKVSPLLLNEVSKKFPRPTAPLNEVDYGDGKKKQEPNEADPDFQVSLSAWQQAIYIETQRIMIDRGVVITLTDEQKEDVRELRKYWKDTYDSELTGSDVFVYVTLIALSTQEDIQELIEGITRRSQPTEGAIAEAVTSFRS